MMPRAMFDFVSFLVPAKENPGFSQPSNLNYEPEIVHNCLDMTVTSLLYHCKCITKFILLTRMLLGRKCVQFK